MSIIYITSVTGAGINMHYCMGQLADWSIGHSQAAFCSFCGMENGNSKDNGCCNDELKQVKIDIDQKATQNVFSSLQVSHESIPISFFETPAINISTISEAYANSNGPPIIPDISIYKRNCVFLI